LDTEQEGNQGSPADWKGYHTLEGMPKRSMTYVNILRKAKVQDKSHKAHLCLFAATAFKKNVVEKATKWKKKVKQEPVAAKEEEVEVEANGLGATASSLATTVTTESAAAVATGDPVPEKKKRFKKKSPDKAKKVVSHAPAQVEEKGREEDTGIAQSRNEGTPLLLNPAVSSDLSPAAGKSSKLPVLTPDIAIVAPDPVASTAETTTQPKSTRFKNRKAGGATRSKASAIADGTSVQRGLASKSQTAPAPVEQQEQQGPEDDRANLRASAATEPGPGRRSEKSLPEAEIPKAAPSPRRFKPSERRNAKEASSK